MNTYRLLPRLLRRRAAQLRQEQVVKPTQNLPQPSGGGAGQAARLLGMGEASGGVFLLYLALAAALLFHGGLLAFTHGNTYDAYIHMFFADHYNRSWFDPWEPRWYTGFSTTSYPPGTHMMMGVLQNIMALEAAFVVVQTVGLLILVIGVYRFSLLWVRPRAAGYAALTLVLASSISETIHIFGQLPTIFSLAFFLNCMPHVFSWLVKGRKRDLLFAAIFAVGTTSAHHVTTLFGMVLFIGPLALHALRAGYMARADQTMTRRLRGLFPTLVRGGILGVVLVSAIVGTVFPYWYWSITDPITQVTIPHGSRESFIERLDLGLMFFLLPWGITLAALPYLVYKSLTSRLWPLGMAIVLCFVLGTGGTTPIPRMMLGGAFDILTLDRFTFWGSILALPVLGFGLDRLIHGPLGEAIKTQYGFAVHRTVIGSYFVAVLGLALFIAVLPTMRPTQPDPIDATPITTFMERDEHHRWRYLTLGFGDQFAIISSKTFALSVDGNYHSARRLPALTSYAVERLENAKYLGVPGLGSLQQFLVNAEAYNLKYVFSVDAFYDPILFFTGWTRLNRLPNGVTVWEKADVPSLPSILPRRPMAESHALMWAIIPPAALLAAFILFFYLTFSGRLLRAEHLAETLQPDESASSNVRAVHLGIIWVAILMVGSVALTGYWSWKAYQESLKPERVVEDYLVDLDFRRFASAYNRLDPESRPDFEGFMFQRLWRGGLVSSFGKLTDFELTKLREGDQAIDWHVDLTWLTSLGAYDQELTLRTLQRDDGKWYIVNSELSPQQTPTRIDQQADVSFSLAGRRQPRPHTDLYRDRLDRPNVWITNGRLVKSGGRYAMVGNVYNADADPAFLTISATLRDSKDKALARANLGQHGVHRLLPAESAGFRIDFEGVLSLQDAELYDSFDPKLFIPPELDGEPAFANLEARALAHGSDLYRGVSLSQLDIKATQGGVEVEGLASNNGTTLSSITRLTFTLIDLQGLPIWVEARFIEADLIPGQQQAFRFSLPPRSSIELINDLDRSKVGINGSGAKEEAFGADNRPGNVIPLDPTSGYSAVQINISSMTHDPLF